MSTSFESAEIVKDPLLDSIPYNLKKFPDSTVNFTRHSSNYRQPVSHEERAATFLQQIAEQRASNALAKISLWLNGSEDGFTPDYYQPSACPKSQEWLNANHDTLRDQLNEDFFSLSRKHISADRGHFENALSNGGTRDAFKLHDLAYMGIEGSVEDLQQARNDSSENPDKINELTIKLVSATAVRAFYLDDISKDFKQLDGTNLAEKLFLTSDMQYIREHTKSPEHEGLDPYGEVFKQNMLSAIYAVARLGDTKQPHVDEPPASSHR